jgi:general secretion pathway protein L
LRNPSTYSPPFALRTHAKEFWAWWLKEFSSLLPTAMVAWLTGQSRQRLWLAPEDDGLLVQAVTTAGKVLHRDKVSWEAYALTRLKDCPIADARLERVLALPAPCFFQRRFAIPALAGSQLDHYARQEIERRTPFNLDDIFTHAVPLRDPQNHQRLQVQQSIIRKDIVQANLARLGLELESFSYLAIAEDDRNLDRAIPVTDAGPHQRSPATPLLRALALIGVILMIFLVAATWWRRQSMIEELTSHLPAVQTKAEAVRRLIDGAAKTRTSIQALLDRKTAPSASDLWEEMSRLLPDDSWLTEFRLADDRLSISGLSANAAGLVAILGRSKLLSDVALSAPITSDPLTKRDRFSLTAKIVRRERQG